MNPVSHKGVTSGLNTNFTLSPSYSFYKTSYHQSFFGAYLYPEEEEKEGKEEEFLATNGIFG